MPSIVSLARLTGRLTGSCMEWGEVTDRLSRRSPGGFSSPSPDRCLVSLLCCLSAHWTCVFTYYVARVDVDTWQHFPINIYLWQWNVSPSVNQTWSLTPCLYFNQCPWLFEQWSAFLIRCQQDVSHMWGRTHEPSLFLNLHFRYSQQYYASIVL